MRIKLIKTLPNKTITLGYMYRYANEHKNKYLIIYKIDCKNRGARRIWIHIIKKNKVTTYGMNIIQVCEEDEFEIAINYYTLRGLIDVYKNNIIGELYKMDGTQIREYTVNKKISGKYEKQTFSYFESNRWFQKLSRTNL